MRQRAFTLLEMMVASTLALVIVAAATTSIAVIVRSLNKTGQSSAADADAQLVSEYLVSQLQGVGGGAVRPWMAVTVRNNSGRDNSDILRFADIPAEVPPSVSITESLPENGRYGFLVVTERDGRGTCGLARLTHDDNGDGFPDDPDRGGRRFTRAELEGSQVILSSPTGETWRSVILVGVSLGNRSETCFAQFDTGGTGLAANGALKGADHHSGMDLDGDGTPGPENRDEWVLGQMSLVRVREWTYEPIAGPRQGRLVERVALKRDFGPSRVLLEGVRDFQVSPGFDYAPFNGLIAEAVDGKDDEWLNSTPNDDGGLIQRIPEDLDRPASDIPPDSLRMLDVAVITSPPSSERQADVRVFDGTVKHLNEPRIAGGRAFLRNQLLFL